MYGGTRRCRHREPTGRAVGLLLPARHVVLEEDLADQFAPAADTGLVEDRLEVILHGVGRDPKGLRDLLMAGEFAVHLRNGDVYSVEEMQEWLAATGWQFCQHAALAGPQSVIVAEADDTKGGR